MEENNSWSKEYNNLQSPKSGRVEWFTIMTEVNGWGAQKINFNSYSWI